MLTMIVILIIILLLSWNIKSMLIRYLNGDCKGCKKDCSSCQAGASLYEAYHRDHAK